MHVSTLCMAFALPMLVPAFEHVYIPIAERQAPGTPKYACHEDCGTVISLSRKDGFCKNEEFTSSLSDCLECAVKFDIWKYYESGVTKAAEACDLDATPDEEGEEPEPEPTESASEPEPEPTESESESESEPQPTATETTEPSPTATTTSSESDDSAPVETTPVPPTVTATGVTPSGTAPSGGLPSGNTTIISPTASSTDFPPVHDGASARPVAAAQGILAVIMAGLMLF